MTFDFEKQHSTQHSYCKNTQQSTWRGTFKLNHICRSVTTVVGFFVVLWETDMSLSREIPGQAGDDGGRAGDDHK